VLVLREVEQEVVRVVRRHLLLLLALQVRLVLQGFLLARREVLRG
jgi:hypothetical protein